MNEFPNFILERNIIKYINGNTFTGLNKLREIDLSSNSCVNTKFVGSSAVSTVQNAVRGTCAINEQVRRCDFDVKRLKSQVVEEIEEKAELLESLIRKNEEVMKLRDENFRLRNSVGKR